MSARHRAYPAILVIGLCVALSAPADSAVLRLGRDAPGLQAALDRAQAGDVIEIPAGHWPGTARIDKPVSLRGLGGTLDGGGSGSVLTVLAADVVIEGLTVTNSGYDVGKSDACIYLAASATNALVRNNELIDCAFGIWVHETQGARIEHNYVAGRERLRPTDRGNGIHLFNASELVVRGNHIEQARDGIYVSATEDSLIEGNRTGNQRFGIHYMYSYDNVLRGNTSYDNIVGFALMESKRLLVEGNAARRNERDGLLFRNVQFSKIRENQLERNGIGMFFYSSTENEIEDNTISDNEMGLKIWAGTRRNVVAGNWIHGNRQQIFYVGAADQVWGEAGRGNRWGDYLGWDQDGDGVGDRPHRADSFSTRLIYQYPASVLLLRSPALEMLSHLAEDFPMLRTPTIVDLAPLFDGTPQ